MSAWFSERTRIGSIPADDRAAQYGDGLFETIATLPSRATISAREYHKYVTRTIAVERT
jgi:hypothetical protein